MYNETNVDNWVIDLTRFDVSMSSSIRHFTKANNRVIISYMLIVKKRERIISVFAYVLQPQL